MKKNFPRKKEGTKPPANRKHKSSFTKEKGVFKPHVERASLTDNGDMRLNKYLALCGISSRRGSADLIKEGVIYVNGKVATEIGLRISSKDEVTYKGKKLEPISKKIYILLNKPKDTITTVSDEKGRKTVMDIVGKTIKERIYPVGRLDRDTVGLLVLTNDGELAQKLSHPSFKVKKLYHAMLNRALTKNDLERIREGLELEDGKVTVDGINYVEGASKDEVMVEIHVGKNRIVRRIFEHLGYEVSKLDRVYYGGLTKKDLPRGSYRSLTQQEIIMLKHFSG